ncbi:MAG TPA: hypothetical protein VFD36_22755 [Kofleriaceae bacterium]|nr:hypothetical protein [Kofleriaceae bacterium]
MSSSKTASASGTPDAATDAAGVSLGAALERLLYFNGRFLKAEDLRLEQSGYLTRIALSERAQGAGVSYGFHVTAGTSAAPSNFVKSVADAVFAKMQANRTDWVDFLDENRADKPPPDAALIERLAGALDTLCGSDPGNTSGLVFTIAPGHGADGHGHDLLLDHPHQVKLAKLIDAFTKAPTFTDAPGPVITPKPLTSLPPLTGAFLLTLQVNHHDHGNVPVYGAQCTDARTAACSLGFRSNGVSAQLVFFDALDGAVPAANWWTWRGMGARAYFERETATRPSLLPDMLAKLPFSAAAHAPETGTHVPIGVVYLHSGHFVTFDPWTSKRLRLPGELTYWLRALLYPAQVSQLARVLQFESQLTDALSAGVVSGTTNLWKLGFADAAELVLPGVGFLPIAATVVSGGKTNAAVTAATLAPLLDAYFDGVPYKIMEASEGEMNALFVGALESGELRLRRTAPPGGGGTSDDCERVIAQVNATVDAWIANPTSRPADVVINQVNNLVDAFHPGAGTPPPPVPTGPPQVLVWFTPNPFPGYVMFTWPVPAVAATAAAALPRVCTQVRLAPRDFTGINPPVFEVLGHDGEWATYFTSGMGMFFTLAGLRLELERPFPGLALHYAFVTQNGADILPAADGWLVPPPGGMDSQIAGLRVWLTGTEAEKYSVLYRVRLRLGDYFHVDSPTFQNGDVLTGEPDRWTQIPADVFRTALELAFRTFNPNVPDPPHEARPEALWVSIVPRCPSETASVPIGRIPGSPRDTAVPVNVAPSARLNVRWNP